MLHHTNSRCRRLQFFSATLVHFLTSCFFLHCASVSVNTFELQAPNQTKTGCLCKHGNTLNVCPLMCWNLNAEGVKNSRMLFWGYLSLVFGLLLKSKQTGDQTPRCDWFLTQLIFAVHTDANSKTKIAINPAKIQKLVWVLFSYKLPGMINSLVIQMAWIRPAAFYNKQYNHIHVVSAHLFILVSNFNQH